MLFGFLAIGGCDRPVMSVTGTRQAFEHAPQQCVRHLFVDSNGTYNSGVDESPVIVSGIFVKELDRETDSLDDLFDYYKHVRKVSEMQGYAVIQGLKQFNMPVMYLKLQE